MCGVNVYLYVCMCVCMYVCVCVCCECVSEISVCIYKIMFLRTTDDQSFLVPRLPSLQ